MNDIEAGCVVRWYSIGWGFFRGGIENAVRDHDKIMDRLANMRNASEVNSGHTGFNVAFENDHRPHEQIVLAIKLQLRIYAK